MTKNQKLISAQRILEQAVDDGATLVEQVHSSIASMPFDVLENIQGIRDPVARARQVHDQAVANIYETIRLTNDRAGELARNLLGAQDDESGQGSDR